jgi:F-box protein 11
VYASKAPSAPTGRLINTTTLKQRYRIVRKIGQGGFSAVYFAEDLVFNAAPRVLKEMSVQSSNSQLLAPQEILQSIESFKQEAFLLASLTHPNLPRIYDYFEELGCWYIAMDYIEGQTLETLLGNTPGGKLELPAVLHIANQLCTVLDYLHTRQPPIIFRDLKPANIMITADEHIYLIDFGIARLFKPGKAKDTTALGSPGYAAPEQYGRAQSTAQADIYGLGATLHHLLSGHDPSDDPFQFPPLALDQYAEGPALAALIQRMVALQKDQRPASVQKVRQALRNLTAMSGNSATFPSIQSNTASTSSAKSVIVAPLGGQYRTISDAIKNVPERTRILVRPGTYTESINLDKNVEIIGDGPREQILLTNSADSCIRVATYSAVVRGMTIHGLADNHFAIDIPRGRFQLSDCIVTSTPFSCIGIHNSAAQPTIRNCIIRDGNQCGILIYDQGAGIIEDCEILANKLAGIEVRTGSRPQMRRCKIHDGQASGLSVHSQAEGIYEDCEFFANKLSGIIVKTGGNPLVRRCKLYDGQEGGIMVHEQGEGTFEDCEIFGNKLSGFEVRTGGNPSVSECMIHNGQGAGIMVWKQGEGTFEDCEIFANKLSGFIVKTEGKPLVRRCKMDNGQEDGILVHENGTGIFEDCEILANKLSGFEVRTGGNPLVRRCKLHDGQSSSISIHDQGEGTFEDCEIFGNKLSGIIVKTGGNPLVRRCTIDNGQEAGIYVHEQGEGTYEDCNIFANKLSGIIVKSGGKPLVRRCKLHDGVEDGILVYEQGEGIFEDCDIFANQLAGIEVKTGGNPLVRRCKLHNGQASGIYVHEQGEGTFEDCDIFANKLAGIEVKMAGNPLVRYCVLHDGQQDGIMVHERGEGMFEDCDIFANKYAGFEVRTEGKPLVRRCKMHDGLASGIYVHENGEGIFEDCSTFSNMTCGLYVKGGYPVSRRCKFRDREKHER